MAIQLTSKAPSEVLDYRWEPVLEQGDSLASYTIAVTGATLEANEIEADAVCFYISGGTAGAVAEIEVTATTEEGRTYSDTLLLPIRATDASFRPTAREVVNFAFRRIAGTRRSPTSAEADDALERLNDMLAEWRIDGLDIGIAGELTLDSEIEVPDEFIRAVKYSLIVAIHDQYTDQPIPALTYQIAENAKRLVANRLFSVPDLQFSTTLTIRAETVADLF